MKDNLLTEIKHPKTDTEEIKLVKEAYEYIFSETTEKKK